MTWVYFIALAGLAGFLVEIVLSYQKEAARLRAEQEKEQQAIAACQEQIRHLQRQAEAVKAHIEELKGERTRLKRDLSWDKQTLQELEERDQRRLLSRHRLADEEEEADN